MCQNSSVTTQLTSNFHNNVLGIVRQRVVHGDGDLSASVNASRTRTDSNYVCNISNLI